MILAISRISKPPVVGISMYQDPRVIYVPAAIFFPPMLHSEGGERAISIGIEFDAKHLL